MQRAFLATQTTQTMNAQCSEHFMDALFWNDQTEVIHTLFPEAERQHPTAKRWLELKDSTKANVDRLRLGGLPVLTLFTHAWVGLPDWWS